MKNFIHTASFRHTGLLFRGLESGMSSYTKPEIIDAQRSTVDALKNTPKDSPKSTSQAFQRALEKQKNIRKKEAEQKRKEKENIWKIEESELFSDINIDPEINAEIDTHAIEKTFHAPMSFDETRDKNGNIDIFALADFLKNGIVHFDSFNDLDHTGIWSPKWNKALGESLGKDDITKQDIQSVQKALGTKPDGYFGPHSFRLLTKFRKDHTLKNKTFDPEYITAFDIQTEKYYREHPEEMLVFKKAEQAPQRTIAYLELPETNQKIRFEKRPEGRWFSPDTMKFATLDYETLLHFQVTDEQEPLLGESKIKPQPQSREKNTIIPTGDTRFAQNEEGSFYRSAETSKTYFIPKDGTFADAFEVDKKTLQPLTPRPGETRPHRTIDVANIELDKEFVAPAMTDRYPQRLTETPFPNKEENLSVIDHSERQQHPARSLADLSGLESENTMIDKREKVLDLDSAMTKYIQNSTPKWQFWKSKEDINPTQNEKINFLMEHGMEGLVFRSSGVDATPQTKIIPEGKNFPSEAVPATWDEKEKKYIPIESNTLATGPESE